LVKLPLLSSTKRSLELSEARIARAATITLGYTIFVILFGAIVRITRSGAGLQRRDCTAPAPYRDAD